MIHEEIVELIYKKDEKSFTLLYDQFAKSIFGIISGIVKDNEKAEKLLTEVFTSIWNSLDTYTEDKGRFYSWMVSIAREHTMAHLKSNDSYNLIQLTSDSFVTLLDDENKPETIGIQEYVRKLKPRNIKIIDLLFFKGFTVTEVSDTLEINPDSLTLENRLGINEIRNLLET